MRRCALRSAQPRSSSRQSSRPSSCAPWCCRRGAWAVGRRLEEVRGRGAEVAFTAIRRHGITGREPAGDTELREGDVVVIYGLPEALEHAEAVLLAARTAAVECPPPMNPPKNIQFPARHTPLREDIHALGQLMGEVLREQGGEELLAAGRAGPADRDPLAQGCRRRRRGPGGARARAAAARWRASWCGRFPPGSSW